LWIKEVAEGIKVFLATTSFLISFFSDPRVSLNFSTQVMNSRFPNNAQGGSIQERSEGFCSNVKILANQSSFYSDLEKGEKTRAIQFLILVSSFTGVHIINSYQILLSNF